MVEGARYLPVSAMFLQSAGWRDHRCRPSNDLLMPDLHERALHGVCMAPT